MFTNTEHLPRLDELWKTGKAHAEDPAIPAIAVFSLLLSLGAKPESREKLIFSFFNLLDQLRPDITPEMTEKIAVYIAAATRDGIDYSKKTKDRG